ncbi:MAG: GNAT family N-acetyltransferase [Bacteroidales bacterium]|nr:GNAT family N-acetyltransferase [Bacteroidales bacterium]
MHDDILTGVNVRLRALEPGDVDLLYAWENDTSVWDVSNTLVPFSRFQIEEYVLNTHHDLFRTRQLRLMVDLNDTDEGDIFAGTIDLFDFEPFHHRAGVGVLIREPYRKKGYAYEAMELFIRYAFNKLQLHQLYCNISPDNVISLKLFEKLGFLKCGIKKDWMHNGHTWQEEWMFQLINHGG